MAQFWKEKFDNSLHRDFMSGAEVGGSYVDEERGKYLHWVYFVKVNRYTFQFLSLDQLDEMISYLSNRTFPSSRVEHNGLEHYWQSWQERLPKGVHASAKREKIVKALQRAREEFAEEGG